MDPRSPLAAGAGAAGAGAVREPKRSFSATKSVFADEEDFLNAKRRVFMSEIEYVRRQLFRIKHVFVSKTLRHFQIFRNISSICARVVGRLNSEIH